MSKKEPRKTCETCIYYYEDSSAKDGVGVCRRFPPKPMGYFDPNHENWIGWSAYTEIHRSKWCGEYERLIAKYINATPDPKVM